MRARHSPHAASIAVALNAFAIFTIRTDRFSFYSKMSSVSQTHLSSRVNARASFAKNANATRCASRARVVAVRAKRDGPVVIGLAADSGCGKSTFMRRMTSLFGGKATPPEGGNPDSNTLISNTTTVLCLDDYHLNDRAGRKKSGLTALNLKEQNFGALENGCLSDRWTTEWSDERRRMGERARARIALLSTTRAGADDVDKREGARARAGFTRAIARMVMDGKET